MLDWSSKDQIAVGCTTSVILWNNNKTQSEILLNYPCENLEERQNKILASYTGTNRNEGEKLLKQLRNHFDNHIKYQEEVEDMINDINKIIQ